MSKRSRTTLTIQIKLPLPPGATQSGALSWLHEVIKDAANPLTYKAQEGSLKGLQVAEVQLKIVARDTVYL